MILGYGMQDPDNWDTDAYGCPVDPYQDEWDSIDRGKRGKLDLRKRLGVGDPIKPHLTVTPLPLCTARIEDPNHSLERLGSISYSGAYHCRRCRFAWESIYPSLPPIVSIGHRVTNAGDPGMQQGHPGAQAVGYELPSERGRRMWEAAR